MLRREAATCRWLVEVGRGYLVVLNLSQLQLQSKSSSLAVFAANASDAEETNRLLDPSHLLLNITGGADAAAPAALNCHSDRVLVVFQPSDQVQDKAESLSVTWHRVPRPVAAKGPAMRREKRYVTLCQKELYSSSTCIRIGEERNVGFISSPALMKLPNQTCATRHVAMEGAATWTESACT